MAIHDVEYTDAQSAGYALLRELERYGKPSLEKYFQGWHTVLQVSHPVEGITFTVRSEHDHQTPEQALIQCHERLIAAINSAVLPERPQPEKPQ